MVKLKNIISILWASSSGISFRYQKSDIIANILESQKGISFEIPIFSTGINQKILYGIVFQAKALWNDNKFIYLKKFFGAIDMSYIAFDTIDNSQEYIFNEPKEQFEGSTLL